VLAGRAAFFDKGKIVVDGPVEEIVERFHWIPRILSGSAYDRAG